MSMLDAGENGMPNQHGDFVWYELLTSDTDAAADFYNAVVGWRSRSFEGSAQGYRIFSAGDADVAGLMAIPAEAAASGMRPCWLGYIGVDDVDDAASRVVEAGGRQHIPPTDIPGVGRFAMLADPQGVTFYVMRGTMEGASTSFDPKTAGHCHWNELATSDPAAALAFYGDRFGWTKGDVMPMGEMGDYQFITHHGETLGAVMNQIKEGPPPMWKFYFGVRDIDVAHKAATGRGATIHHGPVEVPGGLFIIVGSDPQGAMFGLVGPRPQ
jgi:predicted enzyme related to lactoylglutathione lyase